MSRSPGTSSSAIRRRHAARLLANGHSVQSVADAVGISVDTARRFKAIVDSGGIKAIDEISVGGKGASLDDAARTWIVQTVRGSPRLHGFEVDQWTCPKLVTVIERQLGMRYSTVYVRQLTIDLGVHDRMRTSKQPYNRPPRVLDDKALSWIAATVRHSPRVHDFDFGFWTTPRLIALIERKFGVRYSRRYVWQIVVELGLGHLLTRLRK
ncbi:winged helix-turn-helix domain-containing protein (plasmid) [Paraburkholderia sp. D15]|uniref:helix-turn-helix domain-containing protein n=1 Tax=Paraburkholderia sp. D15 TaxID=2880218 RepID=UPI00247A05CC|nr:winged helix-turn-helix domain-containing protein [Paraburkholderia sp. D15]WGS54982.1 winged helix-turn-helix domain-containing protein [Paraburkholderia sp. D15]